MDPLGRPPAACALGLTTVGEQRDDALRRAGITDIVPLDDDEREIEGPAVVLTDEVWITRRAARGFVQTARRSPDAVRLCLPKSRQLELFLPLQDLDVDDAGRAAFPVAFVPSSTRIAAGRALTLGPERWVEPPYKEILLSAPIPRYIMGRDGEFTFPLTSTVVMRMRHWVHLLRASHLAPQVALLDRASDAPLGALWRGLFALRPTRAALMQALKARFVYRGRRVVIHPTATVEASVLGDDVTIGPHAYVVGSVLGAGTYVEDRAHVNQSALGPRTFVSRNSSLSACLALGDTDACTNGIQACVIAERCGLTSFARPLDIVPGDEVRVLDGAELRKVGEMPCGVAFGPGVFVGADVQIAPGRAIPAGLRLLSPPAQSLRRVPAGTAAGTTGTVVNGQFTPL